MIHLKSAEQIQGIRESCQILVETFLFIKKFIHPGIKTSEIDKEINHFIRLHKAVPSFKGFNGYPANSCISIDEQVVHGIPGSRRLEDGQIVGLDIGVNYQDYFSDAAYTFPVGKISEEKKKLIAVTRESLYKGIEQAKVGKRISDISHAVQKHVESCGFAVVRELVGHGVGLDVWEMPQVPNYGLPGKGTKLMSGMVLAIEPMVNLGTYEVETLDDSWTVVTKDRKCSAHFEHTVAILDHQTEILTEGISA